MSMISRNLEVHISPQRTWQYLYLPFDVPPNTTRIDVTYSYDDAISSDPMVSGGNVIDIGIFDPRGVEFMSGGFRGWSGSARSAFYIAQHDATPGYLAGPIQPGTWSIALGPYKVAVSGCDCRVSIMLTVDDAPPEAVDFPPRLTLSAAPAPRVRAGGWYRGELHCHTEHSDGDSTVQELVARAEALGLDFLAITDHNNLSHLVVLAQITTDLMLIPGFEVTTYYGHWNVWGGNEFIDFRVQAADDLQRAINVASARGLLVSCNHPRPYGPDWAFPEVDGYACVEVWNGPWELLNTQCLAFWEARLQRGERLTAVGGSDHHFSKRPHIAQLSQPTTFIHCPEPPSPAALIAALRLGRAFIAESPNGPRLILRVGDAMMGDVVARPVDGWLTAQIEAVSDQAARLELCGAGEVLRALPVDAGRHDLSIAFETAHTPYIYARLVNPQNAHVRAITNPVYLTA